MQRPFVIAAVSSLIISAVLSACVATPAGASPTQGAQSPPSPGIRSEPNSFRSTRYPYSVDLPSGWTVAAASQGSGSDKDVFMSADQTQWVTVGSGRPDPGQTVGDRVELAKAQFPDCSSVPEDDASIDMGGEPGILWSYTCADTFNLAVQTIHNGIGYRMTVGVPRAELDQARETMTELLTGFGFTDGPGGSPNAP